MSRFTEHAYQRYWQRTLTYAEIPPDLRIIKHFAHLSRKLGVPITRKEAAERVGAPVTFRDPRDLYFVTDGIGPGVWVACLKNGTEVIVTYLAPVRVKLLSAQAAGRLLPGGRGRSVADGVCARAQVV